MRRAPAIVASAILLALVAAALAGCLSAYHRVSAAGAETALAPGYAGRAACARCHADVAAAHRRSGHAETLQRADSALGRRLKPSAWFADPVAPVKFRITRRAGVLGVEVRAGDLLRWQPATWLFGSGRHGITPVADGGAGRYMELPLSYYPQRGWDLTPGYLRHSPGIRLYHPAGVPGDHSLFVACFACHATAVSDTPVDLDLTHMRSGVQCENCHGPGERHVRAAEAHEPRRGTIRRFGDASAEEVRRLCGECHRAEAPPGFPPDAPQLVRFAPVGLARSRCYRESGGRLSCMTCHDPHHDDTGVVARSEQQCLSCHGTAAHAPVKQCPVNKVSGCVSCHMPKAEAARHSFFTDHWIRPHRPGDPKPVAPRMIPIPVVNGASDH